jgi:alkanesulfonate monooxygenase SsuD/methylene tetrahydromethanopterin reductase-like flavin-dependent oxidoreductase (luciferase family)
MKLGVEINLAPSAEGRRATWAEFRAIAEAAEATGMDSVWLADHFGLEDAWTMLSALAAVTSRVQLGTVVTCSAFRNPGLMASMATTLDRMSGGRLILGVGCGNSDAENRAFGYPTDHRVSRFAEWLEIVQRLLRAETVTFDGRFHQLHEARIEPVPERPVPTFVAAGGPRMRAITEEWADARLAAWYGAPAEAEIEPYTGIVIRDPEQPPVREPEPYAIDGSVEEVAAVLAEYEALGVEHLIVLTEPITVRSFERLAQARRLMLGDRGQLTG